MTPTSLLGPALAVVALLAAETCSAGAPLSLHPKNPHYFLFRGKPAVLIGSGEHYGAVLNLDFDYLKYLDTLQRDGMNHTRTFAGAYVEPEGAFKIVRNTLAPAPGRFICPWARGDEPGYANGGNKFDLTRFDEAYFQRLRDFVAQASERGIVVEVNLFCPFYGAEQWALSPMNAANNVNGIGDVSATDAYTLDRNGGLLDVQEAMVRKVVGALRPYDNLYYEIMNEPYARKVPDDWQRHIADFIVDAEKSYARKHLISQNIANGKANVGNPHPAVSILNFHYAWPPETVAMNYGLNLAIGDNETGFKGTGDVHYRMEGWAFILTGGALYSNLDYSFTVGHEDGTFELPEKQPGGGGPALRRQLRGLSEFIHSFDFVRMAPDRSVIASPLPEGLAAQALAEPGKQYAIYLYRPGGPAPDASVEFSLDMPRGRYRVEWVEPMTGAAEAEEQVQHLGGQRTLSSPPFNEDVALRVVARR
jgi:hypothetical protein